MRAFCGLAVVFFVVGSMAQATFGDFVGTQHPWWYADVLSAIAALWAIAYGVNRPDKKEG